MSPDAVVKQLYHLQSPNKVSPCLLCDVYGLSQGDTAFAQQTFTGDLETFFVRVMHPVTGNDLALCLGFDPLVDGQDALISDFLMKPAVVNGDQAAVKVSFLSFARPVAITFDLRKINDLWKLEDIATKDYSVKAIARECMEIMPVPVSQ